jgi:hypothetical protein
MYFLDSARFAHNSSSGSHVCWLYQSEKEHRAVLAPFLRQGLDRGERVVCISGNEALGDVADYLADEGRDSNLYVQRGQLMVVPVENSYKRDGDFDPDKMVELWKNETARALADGYTGLRVTGEPLWLLEDPILERRLIEYEAKIQSGHSGNAMARSVSIFAAALSA